ncbi:hypothetical protein KA005_47775 [bacterium]|nr:hypothetical protein [bacterium]
MEITRNVIIDLLPLYQANEVSADTRALIEEYLETDKELARVVKQSVAIEKPEDIPVPLTKDDEMIAYKKAKQQLIINTLIIAGVIASIISVFGVLLFFYFTSN